MFNLAQRLLYTVFLQTLNILQYLNHNHIIKSRLTVQARAALAWPLPNNVRGYASLGDIKGPWLVDKETGIFREETL